MDDDFNGSRIKTVESQGGKSHFKDMTHSESDETFERTFLFRKRSATGLVGNIVISWSRRRCKRNFGQGVRD